MNERAAERACVLDRVIQQLKFVSDMRAIKGFSLNSIYCNRTREKEAPNVHLKVAG